MGYVWSVIFLVLLWFWWGFSLWALHMDDTIKLRDCQDAVASQSARLNVEKRAVDILARTKFHARDARAQAVKEANQ